MYYVYVLDIDGNPLMPTKRFGKVRKWLKNKKAKVVRKCPFTIQLLYRPETSVLQPVVLGQDTGSKHIGTACISNGEVLYQSQVQIRQDIKKNMEERKRFRRNRRSRKTRYRKARFLNRKNSKKEGRLPPSVKHKVQAHKDEIEFCKKILPISKIVLEVSQFDIVLLKNPELLLEENKWGYQQGFNYGWGKRREAILHRDGYKCQNCKAKNTRLEVHHIIYRSQGGTDDETNLITLCEKCHREVHDGEVKLNAKPQNKGLKHATHMNIIRSELLKAYPEAIETFGYITKVNRDNLDLEKDHYIDACVVASGGVEFKTNDIIYHKRRVAKGDYKLTKGARGETKLPTGKILGFRKFDKVRYMGQECFIKGRRSSGTAVLMDIFNNKIDFSHLSKGFKTPKLSNCERISARTSCLCIKQKITQKTA